MKKVLLIVLLTALFISCKKEEENSTGKMIFSFDFSDQADPVVFNKGVAILIDYQFLNGQVHSQKIDLLNIDSNYSFLKYSLPIEFDDKNESYKILKYALIDSQGNELLRVPDSKENNGGFDLLVPFYIHVYKNQTTMIRPKMK